MRIIPLLLSSLLIVALLAGCASTTKDPVANAGGGTSTSTSGPAGTGAGTKGSTGSPTSSSTTTTSSTSKGKNTAPAGSLTASIQKGTMPLNVTFTLKGSDADGDKLTWTFDANSDAKTEASGDGASLPKDIKYSYTTGGNYTALFTISDGKNTTSYKAIIAVAGGGGGAGVSQEFDASWKAGAFGCALRPAAEGSIYQDVFVAVHDIDPATIGQAYKAVFTTTPDFQEVDLEFRDADFAQIEQGVATAAPWTVTGTVPAGAVWISFTGCSATGASVHYSTPA